PPVELGEGHRVGRALTVVGIDKRRRLGSTDRMPTQAIRQRFAEQASRIAAVELVHRPSRLKACLNGETVTRAVSMSAGDAILVTAFFGRKFRFKLFVDQYATGGSGGQGCTAPTQRRQRFDDAAPCRDLAHTDRGVAARPRCGRAGARSAGDASGGAPSLCKG